MSRKRSVKPDEQPSTEAEPTTEGENPAFFDQQEEAAAPPVEEEQAAATPAITISKADAVRKALALGLEKPADIGDYLRREYGLEMANNTISTYKSQIRSKGQKGGRKKNEVAQQPAPRELNSTLEAAREVKALVERWGADTVRGLTDLFD